MEKDKSDQAASRDGSEGNDPDAPGALRTPHSALPIPHSSPSPSGNLGDTQPFRPAKAYRPLTSEAPAQDAPIQQTAPYRPLQPARVTPKKQGIPALILALLALLLVAAAVAAFFIIRGMGGAARGASMPVERALPANTLAYISINPAPADSQRRAFEKLRAVFEAQPGFNDAIGSLVLQAQSAISNTGLSIELSTGLSTLDTLASYLGGNITIALLAPSRGDLISLKPSNSGEISPLAAVDVLGRNVVGLVDLDFTTDGTKQGLIADLRAVKDNLDKAKVVETYRGTDIRQYAAGPVQIYFALLNRTSTAAVGINSVPIKVLIDEAQAEKGLKEDEGFKYLSGKVPAERVATLYANLGALDTLLKQLFPQAKGSIQMKGAALVALSGQEGGAQVDIATQGGLSTSSCPCFTLYDWTVKLTDLGALIAPDARPGEIALNNIPADSTAFVAGRDLKGGITRMLAQAEKSGGGPPVNGREGFKQTFNLDLDNDVLAWMGGDYTLSATASGESMDSWPLVTQVELDSADSAQASRALKQITERSSDGKIQPFNAAGGTFYPLTPITSLQMTIVGVTKDRLMLAYDRGLDATKDRAERVVANLGNGMGTTDKWKTASAHLLPNSNLVGYLDVTSVLTVVESNLLPGQKAGYDTMAAPLLKPLKYVVAGSSAEPSKDGDMSRNLTRIFLGISN